MPYRTFADEAGRSWEIWDVRPERIERRDGERRQERPTPWTGLERRVGEDRRRKGEARLHLSYPLCEGWLVFKSDHEKRRLSPILANWETLRGPGLRALWEKAEVISTSIRVQSA
ncbi:MAG: hypothetical protein WEA80_03430 [Gemmatimonadaceae bacterium]